MKYARTNINFSFVLASRNRPLHLKHSISCIYDNAQFPDNVEILIRFDDDNQLSLDFYKTDDIFRKYKNIRVFVGPRLGWAHNRTIYTRLCTMTKGDFIFHWADDNYMFKKDWDAFLLQFKGQTAVIGYRSRCVITRQAYDKYQYIRECGMGHIVGGFLYDAQIKRCAARDQIYIGIEKLWHTKKNMKDTTRMDGAYGGWVLNDLSLLDVPDREITIVTSADSI